MESSKIAETPSKRWTPAQDVLKNKLSMLQADLSSTVVRRDSVCADGSEQERIQKLRKEIVSCEKELKQKEKHALYAKKSRDKVKASNERLRLQNPENSKELTSRSGPGRKRLEFVQDSLLETIVDIAMFGASAEERRRCENRANLPYS